MQGAGNGAGKHSANKSQSRAVGSEVSRASPWAVSNWEQQEQPGAEPSPCSRTGANSNAEHPKWQHVDTCACWGGLPQALPAAFLYTQGLHSRQARWQIQANIAGLPCAILLPSSAKPIWAFPSPPVPSNLAQSRNKYSFLL